MPVGVERSQARKRPTASVTAASLANAASAGSLDVRAAASALSMCGTKNSASTSTVSAWMRCRSRSEALPPPASRLRSSSVTRPPRMPS
jgi:hypothetical protein